MEGKSLTFFIGLCALPLVCKSARYCYTFYYFDGSYFEYNCKYEITITDRFGIAFGVVTGVGLLVSFFVFLLCKHRQNASYNQTIAYQTTPSLGYAGHQRIIQTTLPPAVIANTAPPTENHPPQTQTYNQESGTKNARGTEATPIPLTGTQLNNEARKDKPLLYKF
ncbi:uncharacterized protein LOC125653658 [Ostrea edulis]|uniref:uncharacterized protein LOC125653658 n=1 Tax=Ostrea edulis TaxID=37623 RepID=UPI0024AF1556|nr:uncharacterized protein LOC125653658 [Ostrea edulis]XP_056000700.1 uncharacterized protein LOC125653658 [Ostrea edulis]